jgi:predicted nucleotidyltransferase
MVERRVEKLRKAAEKFYSKYLATHAIVPFGSAFRGGRFYSEDTAKHTVEATHASSDVDLMLVSFDPKAKLRVMKEKIEGVEISAFEIPYSMFVSWFSPEHRKAEYVRLIPLTTELGFIRGKNVDEIRKIFMKANIQSTKLALERWLYEHPSQKVVSPAELARIVMEKIVPIRIKLIEPHYYRRASFVRQITNNIEDALEAAGFARRIEPKGKTRKAHARFEIVADLKPKLHRFKKIRADWEFLFGKGWIREVRPKRKLEMWLGIDSRLGPHKKLAKWLFLPVVIAKKVVSERRRKR